MSVRKIVVGIVAAVIGIGSVQSLDPPLEYSCSDHSIPFETVYEGPSELTATYGVTESVKQQGVNGNEKVCIPNKDGYDSKREITQEPINHIIVRTAKPAPPQPVYQAPPLQTTGSYRVGAICRDGWQSSATGRGACSHHGGVAEWLYE